MTDIPGWDSGDDEPGGADADDGGFAIESWFSRGPGGSSSDSADDDFELESGGFDFAGWLDAESTDQPEPEPMAEAETPATDEAETEGYELTAGGFNFGGWLGQETAPETVDGEAAADSAGEPAAGDARPVRPTSGGFERPTPKFALFAVFAIALVAVGLSIASTAGMFGFEGPDRVGGGAGVNNSTATESPTVSPTSSPTDSPTGSPTSSPTSSATASPTPSPTSSPTASSTPSPTPTPSPTASPTESPTPGILPLGASTFGGGGFLTFALPLGLGAVAVLTRR